MKGCSTQASMFYYYLVQIKTSAYVLITPSDKFVSYITGLEATFVMEFEKNVSKLQMGKYLLSKLPKYQYSHLECPHFPCAFFTTFRQNVCTLRSEVWKQSTAICKKKDRKYLSHPLATLSLF